ncbi:MAG: hypothetical protein GWN71_20865, partial [Gammaproteobacteria bacterium]|nr:hypothetical protein [Gemmatimonadota bacterium]NIU75925.1 hypothetical protein [Gammaproteobacteria bacterium]
MRYLGADSLEAPTWAPPELAAARREWAGAGGLWLEFVDGRIGLFDYRTGHLRTFEEFEG